MNYSQLTLKQKEDYVVDVYGYSFGDLTEIDIDEMIRDNRDYEDCLAYNS